MKEAMPRIVGNDALKTRLCRDIASGTLPHACILEGARGTGRHTIAMMAAAALACTSADDPDKPLPCLECPSCRKII